MGAAPLCTDCKTLACCNSDSERPGFCPFLGVGATVRESTKDSYRSGAGGRIMRATSAVMSQSISSSWSRVQELVAFCREMGIEKIGLAYCIALRKETRILAQVLGENGLEVREAFCKMGGMRLSEIGIGKDDPDCDPVSCDPLVQAHVLNEEGTGLNVLVGLCLGHDILFMQNSDAPCTTLIVKDIKYRHNPITGLRLLE